MNDSKIRFAFFTIPEYEKEQEWLRKQHREGWKLINATIPGFYKFERCEPEDVVYQLDYNKEGMSHKGEYVQMFHDCGWEYITDMAGYSYFRKPVSEMNGEEEIFCDDISRMDMIDRVFKGRMIPLLAIFFLIIIPQMVVQSQIGDVVNWVLFGLYVILFGVYLWLFVQFGRQYAELKKRLGR